MRSVIVSIATVMALSLAACNEPPPEEPIGPEPVPVPQVDALSTYSAAVGQEIRFSGTGFIAPDEG